MNLSQAAKDSATSVAVPKAVTKDYNGSPQGAENESWYTTEFANAVDIQYFNKNGQTEIAKPTAVGEYQVKFTLKSGYFWEDNDVKGYKTVDFTINKALLDYPSFFNGKDKLPYNGGENVTFTLGLYDTSAIEISFNGTPLTSSR
ncbi:MAG: hypothetical protein K2N53_06320, partial [Clostridia bacterium]|nr:hypothetical protein [Clostridia bacterium]